MSAPSTGADNTCSMKESGRSEIIFDISFSFPLCYHFNTYYLADCPENKEILNEILELLLEKGNEAL